MHRHPNDGVAHAPSVRRLHQGEYGTSSGHHLSPERRAQILNAPLTFPKLPPPRRLPQPVNHDQRTANALRPHLLHEMIGQPKMRDLLEKLIDIAQIQDKPLDHVLLVGPAGTGKSTVAHCIANEMGTNVYQIEAPLSHETLLDLRQVLQPRDVVFVDEIHQQSYGDRRGRNTNNTPEVFYGVLEDRTLVSDSGVLDFPPVTFIGGTTDEGQLPDAFVMRFPIRPSFEPYTIIDLIAIAKLNAQQLGVSFQGDVALMFAQAARLTPRVVNNYVRNAAGLAPAKIVNEDLAAMVLHDLNGVADDGLTVDQQRLLRFLLDFGKRTTKSGTTYQASVNTLATAIGKGRDSKSIILRVEPWLLACGLLQITSGGRALTPLGIARAQQI